MSLDLHLLALPFMSYAFQGTRLHAWLNQAWKPPPHLATGRYYHSNERNKKWFQWTGVFRCLPKHVKARVLKGHMKGAVKNYIFHRRWSRRTDSATAVLSHSSTWTAALLLGITHTLLAFSQSEIERYVQIQDQLFKGRGSDVTLVRTRVIAESVRPLQMELPCLPPGASAKPKPLQDKLATPSPWQALRSKKPGTNAFLHLQQYWSR